MDDCTGKNETIFSQNGSQQSGMTAPTPLARATVLAIPGTFGTTPCETWSYSRGGTRHHASMPSMATKSTMEWTAGPRVISETPSSVSQTRSWSYPLLALCLLPSQSPHSLEFILCVVALVCLSTSQHLPMKRTIMGWLTSESPAWHPAWYTVDEQQVFLN